MVVTASVGPTADQLGIPDTGLNVNNISITATKAGHALLLGNVSLQNATLGVDLTARVHKNGVILTPQAMARAQEPVTGYKVSLSFALGDPASAIGDVYTVFVWASAGTVDILANMAQLIMVTP